MNDSNEHVANASVGLASSTGSRPDLITVRAIQGAAQRIATYVQCAPIIAMSLTRLRLKAESLHASGAFKMRGAFNSILSLSDAQRQSGIVSYSSGNHAQALAYAAMVLGVRATVVMPETAPKSKIEGTKCWGAQVLIRPSGSDELAAAAANVAREQGSTLIQPFDSKAIIAATGVIGMEILRQAPDVTLVAAPVGGGGLIAGLAAALKLSKPSIKVIGIEPELSADAYQSFKSGQLISLPAGEVGRTIADGLRVQRLGALNWEHIRAFVDDVVTVSEREIRQAVRDIAREARLIAEPSGAVAVAGTLKYTDERSRAVAIMSGGNVDLDRLAEILVDAPGPRP